MDKNILRDKLAAYTHNIAWAGWMKYVFNRCGKMNPDGSFTIRASLVRRWGKQIKTEYSDLPEDQKTSDLEQADIMIKIFVDTIVDHRP